MSTIITVNLTLRYRRNEERRKNEKKKSWTLKL